MKYLAMNDFDKIIFFIADEQEIRDGLFTCYMPIADEGASIGLLWKDTPATQDGHLSGVWADYLEDNREDLLADSHGDEPAKCLDRLITAMRSRLNSAQHLYSY